MLASLRAYGRVGVVVPKYGHTAVERNTIKRRLRDAVRLTLLPQLGALDLVVRATPAAYRAAGATLRADIATLAGRLPRKEGTP
jgi:ribonuclease P protein component